MNFHITLSDRFKSRLKAILLVIFTVPVVLLAQQGTVMIRSYTGNRQADVSAQHRLLVDPSGVTSPVSCTVSTTCNVAIYDSLGNQILASTDPCDGVLATNVAISQTTSTKLISSSSGKKNHICSLVLVTGAAEIVNIVEGTGSVCGTSTTAIVGSTTVGNGMSFAANGGLSGIARTIPGTGTTVDTCLTQDGSDRVAGYLTYVQQ